MNILFKHKKDYDKPNQDAKASTFGFKNDHHKSFLYAKNMSTLSTGSNTTTRFPLRSSEREESI